ncbi:uncharacterized protein [Prorops nasuta]|uniref:uncharacterized protein isoform X3 n=1 Tax=Prorops nasuta TaxID=863751 RepID=UPI0034CE44AF
MSKCCGCIRAYGPMDAYRPLRTQGSCGSVRIPRDHTRSPGNRRRRPSIRYDVVRPVGSGSEQSTPRPHLPGSLRGSQNQPHNHHYHHYTHRHEPPPSPTYRTPPPQNNYPNVQRACALHSRLDQPVTSSTSGMDSKKVVHSVQVRSKADGSGVAASVSGVRRRSGPQGLRSPAAKRPLSAPVALQGWLHKQGSEGLMLWKKRWFVLSEYCLFYYKGPEEEKLLGSILLPSYRVTVCRPEDKVNKKFAFKAEHANMRTYHFAADSRESMNQWVNALTLATLLQDPTPAVDAAGAADIAGPADGERSARPSVSSISSILNQSADDSDSGFHGFQSRDDPSQASNNNSSPNSANTASFPNLSGSNGNGSNPPSSNNIANEVQPLMNGWMQPPAQYAQAGTSQQQQQYVQLLHQQPVSTQPTHSHQHQALLHQHLPPHQHIQQVPILQHKITQSPQQPHPGPSSNVQSVQPMPRNFGQPVYANAPPKPRRLTDGSNDFSTPSPDPDYRKSPVSPDARLTTKSPMADYDSRNMIYGTRIGQQAQQSLRTDKSGLNYGYSQVQPGERRTPDTYGRSAKPRTTRGNGDYEDVYGAPQLYQRPAGPVGYSKGPAPAPIPIPLYSQQHQQIQQQQLYSPIPPPQVPIMRPQRTQPPPRPHSADFLEYEATRKPEQYTTTVNDTVSNQQRRPQRPKSSLDIVNPSDAANDGYFYSEERYAVQMRQSAAYLHATPQHHQQQRNQSLSRATTPSKTTPPRERDIDSRLSHQVDPIRRSTREHIHQQHMVPTPLQRHTEMSSNEAKMRRSLRERPYESSSREMLSHMDNGTVPRRIPREMEITYSGGRPSGHVTHLPYGAQTCHTPHGGVRRWNEQQQFARSASARLPRTRHPAALDPDEDDYTERSSGQDSRDGERKLQQREESMKRLLEWKQRMLQSPLTRKPSGSTNRGSAQNELSSYYKQQALLDLAAHEASVAEARHSRRRDDGHRPHVRSKSSDGRRTVSNVSRYNSYSSDDEELGDIRRKRVRRPSHAGRSPRQSGEDRATVDQDITLNQLALRTHNDRKFSSKATSMAAHIGGIPPDAGYEDVNYQSTRKDIAQYLPPPDNKLVRRSEPILDVSPQEDLRPKTAKKPSGILKTPTNYSIDQTVTKNENGRLSTLAGYIPGESWHVQKNVQWISKDDKEEWDSKIDESNVIKEFSYQYIKPEEMTKSQKESKGEESTGHGMERVECEMESSEKLETLNLVQCRIKSFESNIDNSSPIKEMLSMQEPLKVSSPQATEAHVSKLNCSRKTSTIVRSFALSDANKESPPKVKDTEEDYAKQTTTDTNKSVRDLLADFERKSQQVRQEHDKQQEVKHHRGVFSDTETLLYETSSDLDQREKSDEDDLDHDTDQAVPYSIKDDEGYTGTIKKKSTDFQGKRRRRKTSKENLVDQAVPKEDLEMAKPEYTRLSMTESLVTHGEQLSGESCDASPLPKPDDGVAEEHYLPMIPRKAILDPDDDEKQSPNMMENLFANLDHEENSYVEMAQNGLVQSLLGLNDGSGIDQMEEFSGLDTTHYEFVCVSNNKMEPVYMEVSQLSEKNEARMSPSQKLDSPGETVLPRSELPDILSALKSDSSDADDESSKDLETIDAPRHPRFSLSDTFRPASYYLGTSRTMIAELHDSSDSELVSPPPIPNSPPPLEDLESLETQESLEIKKVSPQVAVMKDDSSSRNSPKSWNKPTGQVETHRPPSRFSDATISSSFRDSRISLESASGSDSAELRNPDEEARHRQMKRRPVSNDVCEVLDSLDELESLGSRFDGTSVDLDQYLEQLQARDAFNVDLYTKDLSYNSIYGFNENMMVVDKLQKTTCQDLSRNINLASNLDQPFHYDTRSKTNSASSLPSMRVSDIPPSHQHSQSFTGDVHYENVSSFSPLRGSPAARSDGEPNRDESSRIHRSSLGGPLVASHSRDSSYSTASCVASITTSMTYQRPASQQSIPIHSPSGSVSSGNANTLGTMSPYHDHSRSASQDSMRYSLPANHRSPSSQNSSQYTSSTSTVKLNPHQSYLNDSNPQPSQTESGAPYYYSDLQAGMNTTDAQNIRLIGHTSRLPQLNNQRDDANALNKRNDIGRIMNPISRQIPRQIPVDDVDEAKRIAAELRKTTCQLLADNKVDLVDKRNFYEADTLRRVKSTDPLPDVSLPDINTRNLYPQGLRDKSGTSTDSNELIPEFHSIGQTSHRRSRSLEGLLDDVGLQNLVEQRNRANRVSSVPPTQTQERSDNLESSNHVPATSGASGEFNVEDPWEQDSLWRESLRRVSLRHARSLDNLDTPSRTPPTCQDTKNRTRITRGATYVNDSVVQRRDNTSNEVSPSERPRVKRRGTKDEEDQSQNDDLTYESLSMERISAGGYIWDPENEAYRKPTVEDMNHFLAEQQRASMVDSGRGLPATDRVGGIDVIRTIVHNRTMTLNDTRNGDTEAGRKLIDAAECKQKLKDRDKMERKELMKDPCNRATASGSGSVIGRDPLPPRAVSTSQLPQRTSTVQPTPTPMPAAVSTLPLPRTANVSHRQQLLPVHQSTPQQTSRIILDHESTPLSPLSPHILKAASSGDVRMGSAMTSNGDMRDSRLASPIGHSTQRLVSPAGHLRVVSPIDHRVSSPSDSERHVHSPSERKMSSPLSREVDRGGGLVNGHRQIRSRDSNDLLYKRSGVNSQRSGIREVTRSSLGGVVRVSAGELLGRTHEELVLLLIQLRRQSATLCKAMETCHMEIEAQARLVELDTPRRLENLQKLEELKKHLMDLEKQYEKGKPLVNLVDNMVKLGSLYNRNTANGTSSASGSRHDLFQENARDHRDRLEFNHRVQEQRLLAEERRDWDRLSPDHGQLQAKVQQLYKLDRLLQEESGTLHSLQQDKELLEKALGGLRHKLQGSRSNPVEAERYRKQQLLLERELSRVRLLLAHNSKKLEETVAENARLEQDLVVLRQKLQASRRYTGNISRDSSSTTAALEAELRRVQQLVGDLQRQRQELSIQVRQLTEKSHSLVQQIKPQHSSTPQVHHPKKRTQNSWLETDLDSGITLDHGLDSPTSPALSSSPRSKQNGVHTSPIQYKEAPLAYKENCQRYSPPLGRLQNQQKHQQQQQQPYAQSSQNHISALSPLLREQIHQHQLKQQLLKDQMQGKGSPIQVSVAPLYVNTDSRRQDIKHMENGINGIIPPPEYIPPPPPPPPSEEVLLINGNYVHNDDSKYPGLIQNREKQEIKTVRIVKRESERRQRDRGDRTGNLGIPLTNGLQAPGGAKRLNEDDIGGSQNFEKESLDRVIEESPMMHAQSTVQLTELDDAQFQRSMSLPRGFGGQRPHPGVHQGPIPPPPRSDSMHALRNIMARRHRVRFESHDGSSDSTLSPYTESPTSSSHVPMSSPNYSTSPSYSPSQQSYHSQSMRGQHQPYYPQLGHYGYNEGSLPSMKSENLVETPKFGQTSSNVHHDRPFGSVASINSFSETSPQLSPVFKSEAAKQIIKEMTEKKVEGPRRRQIPKEKRRHYTVSSSKPVLDLEDTFSKMGMGRARDDLDMERALRPRINAPDVVRSTLSHKELKYNESTIDQLLGTPNKIVIPERYIPEKTPELTAEEQEHRSKKAESIRKMLSETTVTTPEGNDDDVNVEKSDTLKRKVAEEKRQREHILQLNQILAKQVMEKSKMVAVNALATLPLNTEPSFEEEDLSPVTPLPLYQQRENFYS